MLLDPSHLHDLYRHASLYVFPSFFEGFGRSLVEAMASGLVCACSNNSSLGELGKGAALLFDPFDASDIAEAMRRLLTSADLRNELIRAGERRAAEFTWSHHVERILHAVEQSRK